MNELIHIIFDLKESCISPFCILRTKYFKCAGQIPFTKDIFLPIILRPDWFL